MKINRLAKTDYTKAETLLKSLNLPSKDIYTDNIKLFEVIENNESIAIGGYERFGNDAILRSVAVIPSRQLNGTGAFIVDQLENLAIEDGIQTFYLLTKSAEKFFIKKAYCIVDRLETPKAIQHSMQFSQLCPKSAVCLTKNLSAKYIPKIIKVNSNVTLKQIELQDADAIFNIIDTQRAYLGQWLTFVAHTHTVDNTKNFIQSTLNLPKREREYVFTIQYNNSFVGIAGFRDTDRANKKTEIGYWISKHFQNRGIVSMSIEKLIDFSFLELELNRIQIRCATDNIKSKKIPKQFNFQYEGTELEGELFPDGSYKDLEVFSLTKRNFHKNEKEAL